jgi:[amino group carrier protein]-lysine/ornithine hydrolase
VDELVLLDRLVQRYSPSGEEGPAVEEFVRVARELGYAAEIDGAGNGVARRGTGRPWVLFLGHIDTVDGRLPVRRTRGRLYGRGAVDAKGPLAAALLAGAGSTGRGTLQIVAAVGEETDSRGTGYLLSRQRPDAVIAGEPSGWDGVTVGYKGDLQIRAVFHGHRSHYSSPAPTAMDQAVDWIVAVRRLAETQPKGSPFRSLTLKVVGLEGQRRGDAESAEATVDLRLPPGISTSEILRALRREAGKRASFTVLIRIEPVEVDRTNPVVESLLAGIRSAGGRPTIWRKSGTSDLNLVVLRWGVPGAAYGPGDAHLDHTDRESLSVTDVRRSVHVLRVAFDRLRASGNPIQIDIARQSSVESKAPLGSAGGSAGA